MCGSARAACQRNAHPLPRGMQTRIYSFDGSRSAHAAVWTQEHSGGADQKSDKRGGDVVSRCDFELMAHADLSFCLFFVPCPDIVLPDLLELRGLFSKVVHAIELDAAEHDIQELCRVMQVPTGQ
jgi:hypothetical protein